MINSRLVTIDSRHTRDMDDGIWVEKTENSWEILVAIADAAPVVPVGGDLDLKAREAVVTRYLPTTTIPMLTRDLSEVSLSLMPNVPRAVIAIEIKLTLGLDLVSCRASCATLQSEAKLAYEDIPGILANPQKKWHPLMKAAEQLSRGLLEKRRARGAMALYDLNHGWATTEEGHIRKLESHERTVGYIIIQELMILANGALAEYAVQNDIPVVFRNHVAHNAAPDRVDLMRQINDAFHHPIEDLAALRQRTHLLLSRATYEATLTGHFGLNLPAYMHFTSPIRRYPDLVNHRQIRAALMGEQPPYSREQLAEIGSHCTQVLQAQRDAKAEHMKHTAEKRARQAIERGKLRGLNDKELERVTKVEARSNEDASEGLLDEFEHRLKHKRLPLVCAAVAFVEAPYWSERDMSPTWDAIRCEVVKYLVERPEDSISLMNLAAQMGWPMPEFQETVVSLTPPLFEAVAIRAGSTQVMLPRPPAQGTTKKQAKQLAALDFLAVVAGYALPKRDRLPEPPPAPYTPPSPLAQGKDPISALQEWAVAKRLAMPAYTFDQTGASNTPTFTCRCECSGVAAEGKAASKQEAKRDAARKVMKALLEAHDSDLHARATAD